MIGRFSGKDRFGRTAITSEHTTTHGASLTFASGPCVYPGVNLLRPDDMIYCPKCGRWAKVLADDKYGPHEKQPFAVAGQRTECGATLLAEAPPRFEDEDGGAFSRTGGAAPQSVSAVAPVTVRGHADRKTMEEWNTPPKEGKLLPKLVAWNGCNLNRITDANGKRPPNLAFTLTGKHGEEEVENCRIVEYLKAGTVTLSLSCPEEYLLDRLPGIPVPVYSHTDIEKKNGLPANAGPQERPEPGSLVRDRDGENKWKPVAQRDAEALERTRDYKGYHHRARYLASADNPKTGEWEIDGVVKKRFEIDLQVHPDSQADMTVHIIEVDGWSDIDLEAEFLDCPDEAAVRRSEKALTALKPHESLYDSALPGLRLLAGKRNQYVNLPRQDKWRGYDPGESAQGHDPFPVDRAGRIPRIALRCRRKNPDGRASLKRAFIAALIPVGKDNLEYSPTEAAKEAYKGQVLQCEVTTDKYGNALIDGALRLPLIAGNTYKLKVWQKGSPATAAESKGSLQVWHYVWIQKVRAGHGSWQPQNPPEDSLVHSIEAYEKVFTRLDDSPDLKYLNNYEFLDYDDVAQYSDMHKLLRGHDKSPHIIGVGFGRTIQKLVGGLYKKTIDVGPGAPPAVIKFKGPVACHRRHDGSRFRVFNWLLEATYNDVDIYDRFVTFEGDGAFDPSFVQLHGADNSGAPGDPDQYFLATHLTIDAASLSPTPDKGELIIKASICDPKFAAGGFAYDGRNVAWVSTEWHTFDETVSPPVKTLIPFSDNEIGSIASHELGHVFGLSARDAPGGPDRHEYCYVNGEPGLDFLLAGHMGNHCRYGFSRHQQGPCSPLAVAAPAPKSHPLYPHSARDPVTGDIILYRMGVCVMFGASYSGSFCPYCTKSIRKVNCNKGWE